MKVKLKDNEQMDYVDACICKGIKPILKPIAHKMDRKDRPKDFKTCAVHNITEKYVTTFLLTNYLKT